MSRSTNARIEKKCKCIIYNCALFVIFCWIHVSLLTCTLGLSNTMFLEAKVQKLHETRVSCIFISHNILLLTFQFLGSYAHIMIQYI